MAVPVRSAQEAADRRRRLLRVLIEGNEALYETSPAFHAYVTSITTVVPEVIDFLAERAGEESKRQFAARDLLLTGQARDSAEAVRMAEEAGRG